MSSTQSNTALTKKIQWNDYAGGSAIIKPFIGVEVYFGSDAYYSKINGVSLPKSFKDLNKAKEYALKSAIKGLEKVTEEFKVLLSKER
jgi:hypothetical protein